MTEIFGGHGFTRRHGGTETHEEMRPIERPHLFVLFVRLTPFTFVTSFLL